MKRKIALSVLVLAVLGGGIFSTTTRRTHQILLTGIVTTDQTIVSSEIQGRLQQLLVKEADTVKSNQLVGLIQPQEWKADMSFYANTEQQSLAQVAQAEADLENVGLTFKREEGLYQRGVESAQAYDQARTAHDAAKARVDSLGKQVQAAEAGVALAKSNGEQVAARRAALEANVHQLAAAGAQKEKAKARLDYTEIRAPIDGIVDVRAALQGEVVIPGQAIVTLINPDNLWVRADVEETYIDRVHLGDKMTVRLTSGAERQGTVFYRAVDADYATQRDVSRTKRDIKTFEIRLHCDNSDRSLAIGMTAYVTLPLARR